jgi:hypothetical protein
MSARLDFDQSRKDRAGSVAQCVLIKQIAGCVRLEMVLKGTLIKFLFSTRHRNREHVTPSPATDHPANTFQARILPAEIEREIEYRSVPVGRGRIDLD